MMRVLGNDTVQEVLRRDKASRVVGKGSELYELKSLVQQAWDYTLPTMTKGGSYTDVKREIITSSQEVSKKFYEKYPVLRGITFENILVGGGSISKIVYKSYSEQDPDVDCFIYGLTVEEASKRAEKFIEQIMANVKKLLTTKDKKTGKLVHDPYDFKAFLLKNDDTVTLNIGKTKIQIIFRLYSCMSEVLHGFDLGSSAIGFDGKTVWLTELGKFAYEYGANIIDTKRRSNSYEKRLVKYFERGFNIVLPNLDSSKLRTQNNRYQIDEICEIPRFVFSYSSVRNNNITVSKTLMVKGEQYDYAPGEIGEETMVKFNITQLLTKPTEEANLYSRTRQLTPKILTMECYLTDELIHLFYREIQGSLMLSTFKPGLADKFLTVISYNELVTKLLIEKVDKYVFVPDLIDRQVQATKELLWKYKAQHVNQIKWRTDNPGGQGGLLTSSINPIFEKPEEWYGSYYIASPTVDPLVLKEYETRQALMQKQDQTYKIMSQGWDIEVDPTVQQSIIDDRRQMETLWSKNKSSKHNPQCPRGLPKMRARVNEDEPEGSDISENDDTD